MRNFLRSWRRHAFIAILDFVCVIKNFSVPRGGYVVRKPFFNDMSATKLSLNRTWYFCKIWTLLPTTFGILQVQRRKLNRFSNITVCQKWLTRHFSWQSELSTEMNNPLHIASVVKASVIHNSSLEQRGVVRTVLGWVESAYLASKWVRHILHRIFIKICYFKRNRDSSQRTKAGYSIPCAIYGLPVRIERRFLGYRNVWCNFTSYHTCILHKLSVRVRFLAGKPHFHMSLFKWCLVTFIQLGGLWWSDTSCVLLKKWKRNGELWFKIRPKSTFYFFSGVLSVFCHMRWKPSSLAM